MLIVLEKKNSIPLLRGLFDARRYGVVFGIVSSGPLLNLEPSSQQGDILPVAPTSNNTPIIVVAPSRWIHAHFRQYFARGHHLLLCVTSSNMPEGQLTMDAIAGESRDMQQSSTDGLIYLRVPM